ncbi:hypothetical protein ACF09G_13160 [Streptomyces albogriseolus]|uniref:hypothetical protein n=1 Tax=Streptomyces albogriseolus TaxID=1887 RepID=UPI0036FE1306
MSVQMRHPEVEQDIEVPEVSVRHYERSGWRRVDGQAEGVAVADVAAVDTPAVPVEEKTTAAAKGRRRSEGEN